MLRALIIPASRAVNLPIQPARSAATAEQEQFKDPYGRLPAVGITGLTGFSAGSTPWKERNLDRSYFDNLALTLASTRSAWLPATADAENEMPSREASFSFGTALGLMFPLPTSFWQCFQYTSRIRTPFPTPVLQQRTLHSGRLEGDSKLTINLGLRWSSFPHPTTRPTSWPTSIHALQPLLRQQSIQQPAT